MGWRSADAYDRRNAADNRQWRRDVGLWHYGSFLIHRLRFLIIGVLLANAVLWWNAGSW